MWLPTGTMANQVALSCSPARATTCIVSRRATRCGTRQAASAANAGVQFTEIGERGSFTADEFLAARKPRGHPLFPPTTLVEVENTHNRSGGIVVPQGEAIAICAAAREPRHRVATSTARGCGTRRWLRHVPSPSLRRRSTSSSVALSKGLGAPGGSLLAGPRDVIARAVRGAGACSAARCGRSGFLAAAASTRSITTSTGSPTITPTPR